jgi:hypothetical protein
MPKAFTQEIPEAFTFAHGEAFPLLYLLLSFSPNISVDGSLFC